MHDIAKDYELKLNEEDEKLKDFIYSLAKEASPTNTNIPSEFKEVDFIPNSSFVTNENNDDDIVLDHELNYDNAKILFHKGNANYSGVGQPCDRSPLFKSLHQHISSKMLKDLELNEQHDNRIKKHDLYRFQSEKLSKID